MSSQPPIEANQVTKEQGQATTDGPATPVNAGSTDGCSPTETLVGRVAGIVADSPQPAGTPAERFQIVKLVAKGGLGVVNLARDKKLHRDVALKQVLPQRRGDSAVRARFLREAEITGQLEHPGIVPVYSLDEDSSGEPYYTMRFIKGRTLAEAIAAYHAQPTPWEFRNLLQRFVNICNTLAYAHSRGFVHRDVKPANVMLGDYGETLVLDWGLAKNVRPTQPVVMETLPAESDKSARASPDDILVRKPSSQEQSQLTAVGAIVGTPVYMSPEQALGGSQSVSPAMDIYALGVILYELLTGQPPYQATTSQGILAEVLHHAPPLPSGVKRGVPRALEAICRKAMARSVDDRLHSVEELAREVEHWLGDEPVQCHREPPLARAARWARRHRTLVAGGTALLLTAVVGLATSTVLLTAANRRTLQESVRAEKNFATAEAVNDFLIDDLLAQASPEHNPVGAEVTVLQLLDRANKRLDTNKALAAQPEVEATIRVTIGMAYRGLGRFAEAERHLRRAVDLRRRVLGPEHPLTLDAMNNLALVLRSQDKSGEAEKYFRQVWEARYRLSGPRHRETLVALSNLAMVLHRQQKTDEAVPLFRQCLDASRATLGPDDPVTQSIENNLALLLRDQGKLADAESLFRETLQSRERVLTADHPLTIDTLTNLATVIFEQDRVIESELYYRRALEASRHVRGSDNSDTAVIAGNLANVLLSLGRTDEAEVLYRESLEVQRRRVFDTPEREQQRVLCRNHSVSRFRRV